MKLVEMLGMESAVLPQDITGVAQTGDFVSLKDYARCAVILQQGAWAGGTPAVTLLQAKDVAGTDAKALGFETMWTKVAVTGTTFVETPVVADTFPLPAIANTMTVIDVEAHSLDTNNGFTCLRVHVATPGANADLLSAMYLLHGARYMQAVMPDAKVD